MTNQNEIQTAQKDDSHLGIAGAMAKSFIHSPLSPLMLVGFLLMGIIGLIVTPRQEDPQISVPMADIFVSYPGASSDQVENQVAIPLEQIMMEIPGVDHVYSASMRDQSVVTIQFEVGEDMEESLVKLYDKLASNMDRIPPGVSQPLVKPKGVDDVPIVTLTLWSDEVEDSSLRLVALDVLKHIKEIPNTSQGFIVSGRKDQMTINIQPEKLAGFGVSLDQIAGAVQGANNEQRTGSSEANGRVAKVYAGSFLKDERDLERLVVGIHENRPVYLRDVATVNRGPGETERMVAYYTGAASDLDVEANGAPAVTLAIAKKPGSNGVTVAENVLKVVADLEGRVIPDNVNVSITRNYGETARDKVNELIFKLFVATGAVVLLVWFFLGWRASAVVAVVIPIVITFTVFMAWLMGFTIDRVSLFALIFSIGILVDDAIVVVENIYRRWLQDGEVNTPNSIEAVAEVGNPTILATFTVVAALLPMGAVRGMMGPYMAPIPALGTVAMIFSLFAAFVFTPWLTWRLRPSMATLHKAEEKEHREAEKLGRFYGKVLRPIIENRAKGWAFLIGLIVVFFLCVSLFYTKSVRVKMLPLDNKPEFNVVVNFPEGTALPVTANLVSEMAEQIRQIEEVTAVQTYVGTASPFNFNGLVRHYYLRQEPWEADIQVQLTPKTERSRSSHDLAVLVREMIQPMAADVNARVQVVEMPPGPPVLQSVVAEVYGPDAETRRQVASDLTQMFEQAEHLDDVDNLMQEPYKILSFDVDREKAQRIGVSVSDVTRTLQMAMGGFVLGDIKYNSVLDVTHIVMEMPLDIRNQISRISQLPVPTHQGTTVPLSELGSFGSELQDPIIFHKDLRPVEFVTAETVGDLAAPIYGMFEVEDLLKEYKTPDGVSISGEMLGPPDNSHVSGFEWAGEWTVTYETFRDMGIAFGVALILIYMLVVWEFGNFVMPAIIMAPIPLTLVGIIPGHWLLNAEFTATSMIGFIALAGIIVRNSILLVDFSRHKVQEGMPVLDALILACQVRTRPIVITALALVGGSSVILFDPIFQGMAVSLLFGVLVSTALTLFIIPLGCFSARAAFNPRPVAGEEAMPVPEIGEPSSDMTVQPSNSKPSLLGMLGLYLWSLSKSIVVGVIGLVAAIFKLLFKRKKKMVTVAPAAPAAEAEKAEAEKAEAEKAEAEKAEAEKAEAEKAEAEKAEAEKAEAEKAEAEKAEAEKAEAEKAETVAPKPKRRVAKKSAAPVKKAAPAKKRSVKKKSASKARRGIRLKKDDE